MADKKNIGNGNERQKDQPSKKQIIREDHGYDRIVVNKDKNKPPKDKKTPQSN